MRIDYASVAAEGVRNVMALERHIRSSNLEPSLVHLVKLRVSYINGCSYCIDMHSKDALAAGETTQRLLSLPAWRDTAYYSERERLALEWAEAVTEVSFEGTDDAVYERVLGEFGERDLVDLTLAIIAINAWNRLAVPFRIPPGTYEPPAVEAAGVS